MTHLERTETMLSDKGGKGNQIDRGDFTKWTSESLKRDRAHNLVAACRNMLCMDMKARPASPIANRGDL